MNNREKTENKKKKKKKKKEAEQKHKTKQNKTNLKQMIIIAGAFVSPSVVLFFIL